MNFAAEYSVEYRGYVLTRREQGGDGTCSIKRPDGTWRYSPPTIVDGSQVVWVISKRSTPDESDVLALVKSEEEARRRVDEWCAGCS
jgi:hypothetical protein